ncbi:MAG: hypothetical protein ACJAZ8_002891, partial [Planctomycetota bacterium]
MVSARVPESAPADEALIRFELQQDLSRRVDALPEPYRGTLIYRFYEGLSIKEIAKATGVPPSTVRSQLARGLERIRLQYNQETEGHSALAVFLVAASSSTNFITRRAAEIAIMQTSTKFAIVGVAALLAITTFFAVDSTPSELPFADTTELALTQDGAPAVESSEAVLPGVQSAGVERKAVSASPVAPVDAGPEALAVEAVATVTTLRARIFGED